MDTAYYEELAGRLYGLLIGLDDRIGSEQARLLRHFIDVGRGHGSVGDILLLRGIDENVDYKTALRMVTTWQ